MIKDDDDLMDDFELDSILPRYITNSEGEKEPFDLERITTGLVIDVGMDNDIAEEVIESVVRKIVGLLSLSYKSISTNAVKDFICEELSARGFDKYRDIYERTEAKKKTKFVLPEEFIDLYRWKQPEWGEIGYLTFKRTYARLIDGETRTEEFFETVRRVVEGCFSLQKEHCMKLRLPWNEDKALVSAKRMYQKMWDFKFIAPGRGLWTMGTPFIDKHGSMALNNCGFASTEDIDVKGPMAFEWCMDALMLGVGVGFDTKGSGKVIIKEPVEEPRKKVFKIPDSREGWVKALGKVLNGFFYQKTIPAFDYSLIRPAGAPIRGFGGVASGPAPLKEMLEDIEKLLRERIGEPIRSADIVDIFNLIGKCVVAGNVRRSAEIALGSMDDNEFITLKQDEEKLKHHRWASNNSVIASVGIDYSPIIQNIAKNGEPGIIWLENAQKFSRMNGKPDYKDKKVAGVNPCVTGDTLIAVADGRNAVPIKILAEEGKDIPIYCKNDDGITEIRTMRNPRITGYNKEIYSVKLDDGSVIKCTGNHKFILSDASEKEAKDLKIYDSLMVMSKWQTTWDEIMGDKNGKKKNEYWMLNNGLKNKFEHTFIFESLNDCIIPKGYVIHHKDKLSLNNQIKNLEVIPKTKHDEIHDISGDNNPMIKWFQNAPIEDQERYREKISLATSGIKNGRYSGYSNKKIYQEMISYISEFEEPLTVPSWNGYARKKNIIYNFTSFRGKMVNLIKKANIACGFKHYDNPALMREYKKYVRLLKESDLEIIFDNGIFVIKKCEICNVRFRVKWSRRESSFCSNECVRESIRKKPNAQKIYGKKRRASIKQRMFKLFNRYVCENEKVPTKSEFIRFLNISGINDFRTAGIYKGYQFILDLICENYNCPKISVRKLNHPENQVISAKMLMNSGLIYNHKVVSVVKIGRETVYNGTVDEFHNFGIVLKSKKTHSDRPKLEFVFTRNCGEQSLESFELCCLVETFPSRHENYEEFQETLKYAYLYAKSVTLQNTHWGVTNAVMGKNRRIGTSQSGIIDAFVRHGRRTVLKWCDKGYDYLQNLDEIYSNWLCIPKSIKITSVKPSGTVSLLPGVSPGIHYPHSKFYIRRVRIAKNSDLIPVVREAGYHVEDDVYNPNHAYVISFPIKEKFFERSKKDISIWEQFENAAAYQRHWSDNQVSITITFKPEEEKDIKHALECYEDKLKGVSLLPILEHGYEQAPYEEITEEIYEDMVKNIKPLNLKDLALQAEGEEGCETDTCLIKKEVADIKDAMQANGCSEEFTGIKRGISILDVDFCLDDEEEDEGK